jgi:hypothetical protein
MANTKIPIELSSTPSIVDNGDATALTIDSSENVGFSITPESHYSDYTNLDFGKTGLLLSASSGTNITSLLNNAYLNSSTAWKYKEADEASKYDQTGGTHLWFTAPTGGSADADLTWTQRLRVDSDGLKFGSDTAAANALDDYEEGTWTPQITASAGSAGTAAYSNQVGRYTKIGNKVFFEFSVVMTNKGSWSSYTRVLGFPFTTASTGLTAFAVARFPDDTIGAGMVAGELQPSSTYSFFTTGSRLDTLHNISNVDTGYYLIGAGHYTI